jgi:hypothetical protein
VKSGQINHLSISEKYNSFYFGPLFKITPCSAAARAADDFE